MGCKKWKEQNIPDETSLVGADAALAGALAVGTGAGYSQYAFAHFNDRIPGPSNPKVQHALLYASLILPHPNPRRIRLYVPSSPATVWSRASARSIVTAIRPLIPHFYASE